MTHMSLPLVPPGQMREVPAWRRPLAWSLRSAAGVVTGARLGLPAARGVLCAPLSLLLLGLTGCGTAPGTPTPAAPFQDWAGSGAGSGGWLALLGFALLLSIGLIGALLDAVDSPDADAVLAKHKEGESA